MRFSDPAKDLELVAQAKVSQSAEEAQLSICGMPRTQQRIEYMLRNGSR